MDSDGLPATSFQSKGKLKQARLLEFVAEPAFIFNTEVCLPFLFMPINLKSACLGVAWRGHHVKN